MNNLILDYLFSLTLKEEKGIELTEFEKNGYVTIVDYCQENEIEIDFSIQM